VRAPARGEQGRTAAWCGRLLLFAALIAGIVTMHTFGHPASGHGGHTTLTAAAHGPSASASGPMDMARPAPEAAPRGPAAHPAADADGGAMDPGSVCRAVLSVWALALLVPLGAGTPAGCADAGLLAALRARMLRRPRPIPPPPRSELLARLSVLRV
jgi:hypothetical protein